MKQIVSLFRLSESKGTAKIKPTQINSANCPFPSTNPFLRQFSASRQPSVANLPACRYYSRQNSIRNLAVPKNRHTFAHAKTGCASAI